MDEENFGFCPRCGAKLQQSANFCPDCGNILKEDAVNHGAGYGAYADTRTGKDRPMKGMFLAAFVLLVIYSVYSVSEGIYLIVNAEGIFQIMDDMFVDLFGTGIVDYIYDDMGIMITEAEYVESFRMMGYISLISGIFSVIAAVLCYMRRRKNIAIAAIIASTLVTLVIAGILNIVIGFLVAYFVYRSPEYFID